MKKFWILLTLASVCAPHAWAMTPKRHVDPDSGPIPPNLTINQAPSTGTVTLLQELHFEPKWTSVSVRISSTLRCDIILNRDDYNDRIVRAPRTLTLQQLSSEAIWRDGDRKQKALKIRIEVDDPKRAIQRIDCFYVDLERKDQTPPEPFLRQFVEQTKTLMDIRFPDKIFKRAEI